MFGQALFIHKGSIVHGIGFGAYFSISFLYKCTIALNVPYSIAIVNGLALCLRVNI